MCGTDNRPPKGRVPMVKCSHVFFQGATYCSSCGIPIQRAHVASAPQATAAGPSTGAAPGNTTLRQNGPEPYLGFGIVGFTLILLGVGCTAYYFLFFDTSVAIPVENVMGQQMGGGRVNNLGLMADRQNGIIIGVAAALAGLLLMIFAESQKRRS